MNKVYMTDRLVDAINNICNDEPEYYYCDHAAEISIRYKDFSNWNKPSGQFYKLHGEDYNRMIRRLMRERLRERSNSIILKQNAQLRKDGYTGPFLGACLLAPPPKN